MIATEVDKVDVLLYARRSLSKYKNEENLLNSK